MERRVRGLAAVIGMGLLVGAAGCAKGTTLPIEDEKRLGGGGGGSGGAGGSGSGAGPSVDGSGGSGGESASCGVPEVCNGADDDCDGLVDEDIAGLGGPCQTNLQGLCSDGLSGCDGGQLFCIPTNQPTDEVCDGLDNNCNGEVDEDNPGGGGACDTGKPGPCAAGSVTCSAGALVCSSDVAPEAEVCDDLVDNDCDGDVDEGCGAPPPVCAHDPCTPGTPLDPLCDPCVQVVCVIDKPCCKSSWDAFCVGTAQVHCACP